MEALVRHIVTALVEHPEQVDLRATQSDNTTTLELRVAPADMGKVIGKQGRIAKAIRTVVKAATPRGEKPVYLEIMD